MCRAYHDDEDDAEDGDEEKLGPQCQTNPTYCDYILAVQWLFLPSNTGCGKEEVLFCWPLIKTVLTPEWSVSSRSMVCKYLPLKPWLQRFKILGYRCSSYSKEIRNTIPRVFPENIFWLGVKSPNKLNGIRTIPGTPPLRPPHSTLRSPKSKSVAKKSISLAGRFLLKPFFRLWESVYLLDGWTNPFEKNMSQIGFIFPKIGVNITKIFQTTQFIHWK